MIRDKYYTYVIYFLHVILNKVLQLPDKNQQKIIKIRYFGGFVYQYKEKCNLSALYLRQEQLNTSSSQVSCPTDEQVNSSKQHGFAIFVINSTKEESNNCRRFTCLKNNLHKFNLKVKKCIFRFQSKGIRNLLEDNFIIIQRNLQKITITDSFINIFDL